MRYYRDIETKEIISETELEKEFETLRKNGETETETFVDYIKNCTSKNGTLERI